MFCTSCGTELKSGSTICQSCGAQSSVAGNTALTNQQPIIGIQIKGPKEKHTTFLFVTSMIFMIFFATRTISGLGGISDWDIIKQTQGLPWEIGDIISKIYNSCVVNVIIIILSFAVVLTFFVLVTSLRNNQDRTAKKKVKLSKFIFAFSIIVTALGIIYLISDCVILSQLNEFIEKASNYAEVDQNALSRMKNSAATGALLFDITFISFGIVNNIKSLKLFKSLKSKEQQTTPEPTIIN